MLWLAAAFAADTWSTPADGISYLHRTTSGPLELHIAFVDLTRDHVYLRATAESEHGRGTSSFANLSGATIAVNGDWFSYDTYYPLGLAVSAGWQWTGQSDTAEWSFINCSITKDCTIDPWGTLTGWTPRWHNAVGGNGARILTDGVPLTEADSFYSSDRHPRTAVGVSADSNLMILVVADGRSSSSVGMTFNEMGALLYELGAWQGMMLDGGGSSTMVVNGSIVNDPSDGGERTVANHWGVMVSGAIDSRCSALPNGRYCLDATRLASCEGGGYSEGDCGYYGLSCEASGDFAYCVDPRCSNGGQKAACLDTTRIGSCTDGVYGEGDCAAYGAGCVSGYGTSWCAYTYFQGELAGGSLPVGGELSIEEGTTWSGTVQLKNTGLTAWEPGVVHLAPLPRDAASPLAASEWLSPGRIGSASASVAAGAVGDFPITLTGTTLGTTTLSLALVADGVTWFADYPYGGGPAEGAITLTVNVVPAGTLPEDSGDPGTPGGSDPGDGDEPGAATALSEVGCRGPSFDLEEEPEASDAPRTPGEDAERTPLNQVGGCAAGVGVAAFGLAWARRRRASPA